MFLRIHLSFRECKDSFSMGSWCCDIVVPSTSNFLWSASVEKWMHVSPLNTHPQRRKTHFPYLFPRQVCFFSCERRLLLIIFWKAACVSVTPYLVQLTFSVLGKMVTSFSSACLFSQLSDESEEEVEDDGALQTYNTRDMYGDRWPLCQETSLAKKMKRHLKNDKKRTSWRDGSPGSCVWRFWTSFWPRFRPRFFQHQRSQKSKSLTCCYLVPRFSVTPYLVPIGKVDLKKKCFHPQAIPFFSK